MSITNSLQNKAMTAPQEDAAGLSRLLARFEKAKARRNGWDDLWQDAYDYALPQRNPDGINERPGARKMDQLYDATALDAVEKLSASLLGNLTPPWTQWFGLKPGPDLTPAQAETLAPVLEQAAKTMQAHFDRSNFIVEMHQCYLDLVVGGTASLVFEEAAPGGFSAFKFTAVPMSRIVLEESEEGLLDSSYRQLSLTLAEMKARYPQAEIPVSIDRSGVRESEKRFSVLECITPHKNGSYRYCAVLTENEPAFLLQEGQFAESPVISFRWLKSPGEIYGRSPVMKALPDIKTANKVVELVLKNASIAVTGIWQADDDGVLNPANIELKPGTIIPKALGSKGLSPLEMPGRFDVSDLILDDIRARIRHALLSDTLGPVTGSRMTATEVIERASEMALVLGATYGRLQNELLTPLILRAFSILRRRGEVPDINIDGRLVELDYRAPLALAQGQRNVQNILSWLGSVGSMGAAGAEAVNFPAVARYLGAALGVPSDLISNEPQGADVLRALSADNAAEGASVDSTNDVLQPADIKGKNENA